MPVVRRPLRPPRPRRHRRQQLGGRLGAADEIAGTVTDLGAVNTPYPDAELVVTAPGEESGTFDSFVEIVIAEVGEVLGVEDALPRLDYTASPNDSVIIEGIAANPTSLGWVGFAFVEENLDTVRPIPVDGGAGCVEPTSESIASGEYPIARDLYIYVSNSQAGREPGARRIRRLLRQLGDVRPSSAPKRAKCPTSPSAPRTPPPPRRCGKPGRPAPATAASSSLVPGGVAGEAHMAPRRPRRTLHESPDCRTEEPALDRRDHSTTSSDEAADEPRPPVP